MEGAGSAEPYSGAATTRPSPEAGLEEALGGKEGDAIGDPSRLAPGSPRPPLLELPDELVLKIFKFVPLAVLVSVVPPVCRQLRDVARDPRLWTAINFERLRKQCNLTITSSAAFVRLLEHCTYLKELRVSGCPFFDDTALWRTRRLCGGVERLDARFCPITPHGVKIALSHKDEQGETWALKELRLAMGTLPTDFFGNASVDSDDTWAADSTAGMLTAVQGLKVLDLSHCGFLDDSSLSAIQKGCPKIQQLILDDVRFIGSSSLLDYTAEQGHHLTQLVLDGERLDDRTLLAVTGTATGLKKLHISFSEGFTDEGLLSLHQLPKLESLKLRKGTSFSNTGFQRLFTPASGAPPVFPDLQVLDLTECAGLADAGLQCIAAGALRLRILSCAWCWELTDEALDVVFEACRGLIKLDLTGVKRLGGSSIAKIPQHLPHLRVLILRDVNNVADALLCELTETLRTIVVINYYGQSVGEDMAWGATGEVFEDGFRLTF